MATKNRGVLQDTSRGADTYFHTMQMALWTFLRLSMVALGFGVVIAVAWVLNFTTSAERSFTILRWEAAAKASLHYPGVVRLERNGRTTTATYQEVLNDRQIADAEAEVTAATITGVLLGGSVTISAIVLWLWHGNRRGRRLAEDSLIRGGELGDIKDVAATLKREKKASDIRLGSLSMVLDSETRHMLVTGTVGAGKSQLISSLLDQIKKRGDGVVIYDKTGEFISRYYDPTKGDVILNPLDARSPYWTPFGEIDHPADAVRMAEALYPEPKGNDPYFALAARAVWASAVLRLSDRKGRDIEMLLRYLMVAPMEELAALVDGTDATRYLATKNSSGDVLAQVAQGLAAFKFLPAKQGNRPAFSIRQWVAGADRVSGRKPWLFISSRDDWHKALRPLISLWFDCVASALLSLPPSRTRRLWLVLDELPTLNNLPSLSPVLAEGRKYGAAGVLGIQTVAQLRDIMGRDASEALMGLCGTLAVFRTPDPTTAQYMGKGLGERDIEETRESLRYSSASSEDAIQIMEQRQVRPVVLPTEIMQLPDLAFYLRLPGEYPIVRTETAYVDRPTVAVPYELAAREDSAWVVMEKASMAAAKAPPAKLVVPPTLEESTSDGRSEPESVSRDVDGAPRTADARSRSRDLI